MAIALHGLAKADRAYVMYYDETNNIRRLHVRPDGLNAPEPQCFVIGGVAHTPPVRSLSLDELRDTLRIQKSAAELKLKHVAKGDFLELVDSARMETFLAWIKDEGFFIHFSVLDPLYWSIIDVVDSILGEHDEPALFVHHMGLKNDLYAVLRHDFDQTVALFQRYSYPNVGRERRPAFIADLLDLIQEREALLIPFNFMMLKGVMQIAKTLDSLPFLEDVEPNVLIDGFGPFFVERLCLLKNANHILDVEDVIREHLAGIEFCDGDDVLTHYRFAVSDDEPGIQIADILIGLIGKFFSFVCETSHDEILRTRDGLTAQQKRTLRLLSELCDRSVSENPVFTHYVLSLSDQQKASDLLGD
ncbi:DUF3800 domain-containing protein [Agrobacterium sp. LMR679]|uniref:DUF3800 domain-containing protein n=1 Tax=Agrobacterium sp. LMR679 TaxID=3014335 RepID=UPI0022AE940B|nr:DUF3800 domain-containing protein [Agrobacterium sp. LMR679]MCZ4072806.1 DUF3800 domain-containing protein [Agrobacterium sp. LMR679]